MWAPQIKAGDVVSGPYAAASTAPIVDRDISAVAVHALLTDELLGQKIPLTGPQALTNTELVERHRHRPRSPVALSGGSPRARASALHRSRLSGRVRRRVHGVAVGDGVQARTGHPRGGENPWPSSGELRRRGCRSPRSVHQLAREIRHVGTTPAPLPQADEQSRQGAAEVGHQDRTGDGIDRAGQEDRQAPQHADDTVHLPRRPVHRRGISRRGLGGQCPGGGCGHPLPRTQVAARSGSSSSARRSRDRCCASSRPKCRSVSGSRSARALCSEGTPDEFEALAGTLAVFRFDPVG